MDWSGPSADSAASSSPQSVCSWASTQVIPEQAEGPGDDDGGLTQLAAFPLRRRALPVRSVLSLFNSSPLLNTLSSTTSSSSLASGSSPAPSRRRHIASAVSGQVSPTDPLAVTSVGPLRRCRPPANGPYAVVSCWRELSGCTATFSSLQTRDAHLAHCPFRRSRSEPSHHPVTTDAASQPEPLSAPFSVSSHLPAAPFDHFAAASSSISGDLNGEMASQPAHDAFAFSHPSCPPLEECSPLDALRPLVLRVPAQSGSPLNQALTVKAPDCGSAQVPLHVFVPESPLASSLLTQPLSTSFSTDIIVTSTAAPASEDVGCSSASWARLSPSSTTSLIDLTTLPDHDVSETSVSAISPSQLFLRQYLDVGWHYVFAESSPSSTLLSNSCGSLSVCDSSSLHVSVSSSSSTATPAISTSAASTPASAVCPDVDFDTQLSGGHSPVSSSACSPRSQFSSLAQLSAELSPPVGASSLSAGTLQNNDSSHAPVPAFAWQELQGRWEDIRGERCFVLSNGNIYTGPMAFVWSQRLKSVQRMMQRQDRVKDTDIQEAQLDAVEVLVSHRRKASHKSLPYVDASGFEYWVHQEGSPHNDTWQSYERLAGLAVLRRYCQAAGIPMPHTHHPQAQFAVQDVLDAALPSRTAPKRPASTEPAHRGTNKQSRRP